MSNGVLRPPASSASAIPVRLSLHNDGWQTCVNRSTSSDDVPSMMHSPYVRFPASRRLSIRTLYRPGLNCFQRAMGQAEAPVVPVVARSIRDPIGVLRDRMQVRFQLVQRHHGIDGDAVAHQMQRVVAEVDDPVASFVLDPCFTNVPLARHLPVEYRRARRYLRDLQRHVLRNAGECLSEHRRP